MQQSIAKILGWVFILVGILGFFGFAGGTMAMSPATSLFGFFPVNPLHNIVHILIGVWGLNAARTATGATTFCRLAGILYLLLAVVGFVPALVDMLAGLVPVGGHDPFLHLVLGLILVWAGFSGESNATVR